MPAVPPFCAKMSTQSEKRTTTASSRLYIQRHQAGRGRPPSRYRGRAHFDGRLPIFTPLSSTEIS